MANPRPSVLLSIVATNTRRLLTKTWRTIEIARLHSATSDTHVIRFSDRTVKIIEFAYTLFAEIAIVIRAAPKALMIRVCEWRLR